MTAFLNIIIEGHVLAITKASIGLTGCSNISPVSSRFYQIPTVLYLFRDIRSVTCLWI